MGVQAEVVSVSGPEGDSAARSRRSFLKLGAGALSLLAVLEAGGAGVLFLQSRDEKGGRGGVVEAGPVEGFPPGSVTEFPEAGFFLVRAPDGGFLAVHRRCPHLGCTVDWEPDKERFYCPCHGSSFDFFGGYEGPPVPRALDIFEVRVAGLVVEVDTSQATMREGFEPGQLAYGQEVVPVENSLQGQGEALEVSGG